MNENKAQFSNIDEYIALFPDEIQEILTKIRNIIKENAPEASEKISYQMPTYFLNGNLIHFAAFKHHIGLYPTPTGIDAYKEELSKYKGAKGSVQFLLDQPIPYDLIKRIVIYRVEESTKKAVPNQIRNNILKFDKRS